MFEIVRYTADKAAEWNAFVAQSKNGTFLFNRAYMDYHSDRFDDYSLMFYREGLLYGLLPANAEGDVLYSHRGLTYGGLLMSQKCRVAQVRDLFVLLNGYLKEHGFNRVVYKHIPWIYCQYLAEEDLFVLTNVCGATVCSRNIASVVVLHKRLPMTTLRRRGIKKAIAAQLQVEEWRDFSAFWDLLEKNLYNRFQTHPVHTLAEIALLHQRFPDNIRLFVLTKNGKLLGGTVLYVCGQTVKTQYISANDEGKHHGAIDLLFDVLLGKFAAEGYCYFDFGTSNLVNNDNLNESLIFQKEGFGGRGVCYDTYMWEI